MGLKSTAAVSVPLTTYAYGIMGDYLKAMTLANLICPIVQVSAAKGTFKKFDDRNAFLVESFKRPLGGARKALQFEATDGSYDCTPYGVKVATDDFEPDIAASGSPLNQLDPQQEKVAAMVAVKARSYFKEVCDLVTDSLTPVAGVGNFSSPDVDPLDQLEGELNTLADVVGTMENISIVMTNSVWSAIRKNPKVKAAVGLTGGMRLTPELFVGSLPGNPKLQLTNVQWTTSKFGQATVTKTKGLSGSVLLIYSQPTVTRNDPSAFKCFSTSSALVAAVNEFRTEDPPATWNAIDWSQDMQYTGAGCARLITVT